MDLCKLSKMHIYHLIWAIAWFPYQIHRLFSARQYWVICFLWLTTGVNMTSSSTVAMYTPIIPLMPSKCIYQLMDSIWVSDTTHEPCKLICVLITNHLCMCVLYHQSRLLLFLISCSFWILLGILFAHRTSSSIFWALLCMFLAFYDINIEGECHKTIHFGCMNQMRL
jgi:hypothetical protein